MKTRIFLLASCMFLMLTPIQLHAHKKNGSTNAPYVARHGLNSKQYQAEFNRLGKKGFRLTQVNGYNVKGRVYYTAIWEKKKGAPSVARHGLNGRQFQAEFNKWTKKGYRLTLINGYPSKRGARYAAIFEKKPGPGWYAHHGMTDAQFQAKFNEYGKKGFRLEHISGYGINGKAYYAAIWVKKKGSAWIAAHHGMNAALYQKYFNKYTKQGYRLKLVDGFSLKGKDYYVAIWDKQPSQAWYAHHNMNGHYYQSYFDNYHYQGFRLKSVSGYNRRGKAHFAGIWESTDQMSMHNIQKIDQAIRQYQQQNPASPVGISLAIAKDERLVFAKGYGLARKSPNVPVSPQHLFRIASISKSITALAIMQLVLEGKLDMDTRVFGRGAILGTQYGNGRYNSHTRNVTIQHLLEHTSGFSNQGGDPIFKGLKNHKAVMDYMLFYRQPSRAPGSQHEYSNFGYCVLGRVIEAVTGLKYLDYLRNYVFRKCGITKMRIGYNTKKKRRVNEVEYFGIKAYSAIRPHHFDALGGWIASPIDLLKLMVRVDQNSAKEDILKTATLKEMYTPSARNPNYAKGWIVDGNAVGHNGGMAGTVGFLWDTGNGYSIAVLANHRFPTDPGAFKLRDAILEAIDQFNSWPKHDLF